MELQPTLWLSWAVEPEAAHSLSITPSLIGSKPATFFLPQSLHTSSHYSLSSFPFRCQPFPIQCHTNLHTPTMLTNLPTPPRLSPFSIFPAISFPPLKPLSLPRASPFLPPPPPTWKAISTAEIKPQCWLKALFCILSFYRFLYSMVMSVDVS